MRIGCVAQDVDAPQHRAGPLIFCGQCCGQPDGGEVA